MFSHAVHSVGHTPSTDTGTKTVVQLNVQFHMIFDLLFFNSEPLSLRMEINWQYSEK